MRRMTVRWRLWGLAALSVLSGVIGAWIGVSHFGTVVRAADSTTSSDDVAGLVQTVQTQWLNVDDQSNMYTSLLALNDASQHGLIETTWKQVVDARQAVDDALSKL